MDWPTIVPNDVEMNGETLVLHCEKHHLEVEAKDLYQLLRVRGYEGRFIKALLDHPCFLSDLDAARAIMDYSA